MSDNVPLINKPGQVVMAMSAANTKLQRIMETSGRTGLLVKQTARGCCQELLGCEAKSEFKISAMEWNFIEEEYQVTQAGMAQQDVLYALEQSNLCCRLFWRDGRAFTMELSEGGGPGGEKLAQYRKDCSMPLSICIPTGNDSAVECPCCCMLPKLNTEQASGASLGSDSVYVFDQYLFVPKIIYRENGVPVYSLKPETCCGGCCPAWKCCDRKNCIYMPFYFHDPQTEQVIGGEYSGKTTPQIRKMWGGLGRECCTTADTFAVMFPAGIDWKRKVGILGTTFLLDFTQFERQNERAS